VGESVLEHLHIVRVAVTVVNRRPPVPEGLHWTHGHSLEVVPLLVGDAGREDPLGEVLSVVLQPHLRLLVDPVGLDLPLGVVFGKAALELRTQYCVECSVHLWGLVSPRYLLNVLADLCGTPEPVEGLIHDISVLDIAADVGSSGALIAGAGGESLPALTAGHLIKHIIHAVAIEVLG
jgi:hypothetical protein